MKKKSAAAITDVWQEFVAKRPDNIRHLYGRVPHFANDEIFLPLQAADFWVWWIRKSIEEDRLEEIINGQFDGWKAANFTKAVVIIASEDQLVEETIMSLRAEYGDQYKIYDKGKAR
jgi:hypothetical protein